MGARAATSSNGSKLKTARDLEDQSLFPLLSLLPQRPPWGHIAIQAGSRSISPVSFSLGPTRCFRLFELSYRA